MQKCCPVILVVLDDQEEAKHADVARFGDEGNERRDCAAGDQDSDADILADNDLPRSVLRVGEEADEDEEVVDIGGGESR
jgi:hypothetical protein